MISIVIPVKNGGQSLVQCLDGIRSQATEEQVEIVIVDSGSSDDSIASAEARSAIVHEIPPQEFSHGASRNLGASHSRGDVLVFISQDAVPVGEHWLEHLTGPLREEPKLAGVYGRQLAQQGARPPERYFLNFLYGPAPRRQRAAGPDDLSMETTLFSNVNAAIPKPIWERFPFVNNIVMSEDQEWTRRVLLEGFSIAYEPEAAVRHSHNYTLLSAFRRFFDSGASADRAYMAGSRHSTRVLRNTVLRYARGEIAWLWATGQRRWIPYAALYEATKLAGLVAGVNHARLPLPVKRQLSAMRDFWG